jgi:hypothetical protein
MNTRRKVLVLVAVLVVLIAVFWLWRRQTTPMPRQETASAQAAISSAASKSEQATTSGAQSSSASASHQPPIPPTQKPSPELKRTFEALNHNPIEFYGRALDQFGLPVAGAEVTGSVLYNTGTASGRKVASTTTDANGYFQFGGMEGQSLGIDFKKFGYDFNPRNTLFWYSYFEADHKRHQSDSRNPVIFTLWKKQAAEPLVHYDTDHDVPANGTPVRINLATGQIGGRDADLVVTVSRTPLQMRYGEQGFAWAATVEVVGGGLIRAGQRDYYNLAPESGYVPRFEFTQEAQNVRAAQDEKVKWTWARSVSDDFFISSRNGKNFARVSLRIMANADRKEGDNIAAVRTTVWLNPNGSRNLEFDPQKLAASPAR